MTPRQLSFARNYAASPNAYRAAKDAGYSEQYSLTKTKRLLANPDVVLEIQRIRKRLNERADKSATDVVNAFAKIAFMDRLDFVKEDPENPGEYIYKAPHELTQDQRDIVEEVRIKNVWGKNENKERVVVNQKYFYTIMDKSRALEQMGRHFGIFDDRLKLTISQRNPFRNATPEQLEQLKKSWIETMNKPQVIDGHAEVIDEK